MAEKQQAVEDAQARLSAHQDELSKLPVIAEFFPELVAVPAASARTPSKAAVAKMSLSASSLVSSSSSGGSRGSQLSEYQIERRLAQTTQSEVLLVRKRATEEYCVLKAVRASSSSVIREVERLAKLRHPLIVDLQRVFEGRYTFHMPTPAEADALFLQIPFYAQGNLRVWAEAVKRDALQPAGLAATRLLEVDAHLCVCLLIIITLTPI